MRVCRRQARFDRRSFLRLAAASALALTGSRASRGQVPAAQPGTLPLEDRLRALAENAELALRFDGSTPAECRAWQGRFAGALKTLLGQFEPPEAWDSVLERTIVLDDHIREERLLQAKGVAPLPFYLLLPRAVPAQAPGVEKRPAILAIHGHGPLGYDAVVGKAETPEAKAEIVGAHYDYGRKLVSRGYVVAAPCLTPFGRRGPAANPKARQADACGPAFLALQYLGKLLIAENLRDILWTLEYLVRHERVNAARLGCVGLSYGGRMTMLTAALEPRIRVAVISGALNCFQERMSNGHVGGCQVIPGLLNVGDVPEIGGLIAPRPCLWEAGKRDGLIDPRWADSALVRMGRAYRALGAEAALHVDRFEGAHEWHGTQAYPLLDAILKPSG